MKEFIDVLNELLKNSLLVNVFIFAFISEFIIYFGIRDNNKNRLFYLLVFASLQLIFINTFPKTNVQLIGFASVFFAVITLWSLNWKWFRKIIFKSKTNVLINGWDTLRKEASSQYITEGWVDQKPLASNVNIKIQLSDIPDINKVILRLSTNNNTENSNNSQEKQNIIYDI